MGFAAEGVELAGTERPDGSGDFDEEEGGDGERDMREHGQPPGRVGPLDGGAVLGEEGVGEVCEDARGVDEDLGRRLLASLCARLSRGQRQRIHTRVMTR